MTLDYALGIFYKQFTTGEFDKIYELVKSLLNVEGKYILVSKGPDKYASFKTVNKKDINKYSDNWLLFKNQEVKDHPSDLKYRKKIEH